MYYDESFYGLTKMELTRVCLDHCSDFLTLNGISFPEVYLREEKSKYGCCGLCNYDKGYVVVWVPSTAAVSFHPSTVNRRWSYPGYRVDRTGMGCWLTK